MTGAEALRAGIARLRGAGVPDPQGDARRLLAHALAVGPGRLSLVLPEPVSPTALRLFERALAARRKRQPVAQIVGYRMFYGRNFRVTPDVLDPRPETETLVATALERPFDDVIDLGTGSGCVVLSLLAERPAARGLGTDRSAPALAVAQANAAALGLSARARFVQADWWSGVEARADLIVSNPPYITAAEMETLAPEVRDWEPAEALTPGRDGLDSYRAIFDRARTHLVKRGRLLVEIGPTQAMDVSELGQAAGLRLADMRRDLDGRDRVVCFERGA